MSNVEDIKRLIQRCSAQERREILSFIRSLEPIHPLEGKLNAPAEVILEAIDRSSDLTQRGIRGIIAEAAFTVDVVGKLGAWRDVTPSGDHAFDFLLEDEWGQVRVQVKMQRRKGGRPMTANEASKILSSTMFVVETQRTRGGVDRATGEGTRPYRFGEFDLLAVSMHASTNDWGSFMYTVADWLLPRPDDERLLLKYQPVPHQPNEDWTNDYLTCVSWLRSGKKKRISS